MARVNVYLDEDLHTAVKQTDINVSAVCQDALRRELVARGHQDLETLLVATLSNAQAALDVLRGQT